jgi:peptidoglycan hydrolase CwlO-like protein
MDYLYYMNNAALSVGKSAFHSFFHNHSEHAVLANKVEILEKREDDYREIVRKVDDLSNNFYELRGEFHSFSDRMDKMENKIDKMDNKLEGWNDTMTALRQYLKI